MIHIRNHSEWHLTYRCDLACVNCNRACFLPPTTDDLTLDDAREFVSQAKELNWRPTVALIGGEPTIHPQFREFVAIAAEFAPGRTEVWSNGYSDRAKEELAWVRADGRIKVQEPTIKAASVVHRFSDMCLSPADYGVDRGPCSQHSGFRHGCGMSVDHDGYTLCNQGGAIDGILKLGIRTKRLADLFDREWAEQHTKAMCKHCGYLSGRRDAGVLVRGTRMSPTWEAAARRLLAEHG